MKTPEEMMEYFRSRPTRKRTNPHWMFVEYVPCIKSRVKSDASEGVPVDFTDARPLLIKVREFFRRYYESFHSEAQVLCVTPEDGKRLSEAGIPVLTTGYVGPFEVMVMVLPQENHGGNSIISEGFWQDRIIGANICPVARIHSHHVLDPYQSVTDYSTLNSGTLEIVIGRIYDERLHMCYWLDVRGTDAKVQTFLALEQESGKFEYVPRIFNGSKAALGQTMVCE